MKGIVLLILGFVLGIFTSYGYSLSTSNQTSNNNINNQNTNIHANHMMNGMPSMNAMMVTYSDLEYLRLMIIHHQDALDMAQRALKDSKNQFVLTLSENIIKTQSAEIEDMKNEMTNIVKGSN
ncbi:DUF305 domain-containing protein [bacterium]|jgi:uncharacterized protein (DUF305 family)|nr:DUF305 domain-containing protein [bacterium]NBO36432.1 DUF305 domain-containing protein [bacterium]